MRLTGEQQRLIESNLGLAIIVAAKTRSRLTFDEKLSATFYALCISIESGRGVRSTSCLVAEMRWAINREFKRLYHVSVSRPRAYEHHADRFWLQLADRRPDDVEIKDEADFYRSRFDRLTDSQRRCIELRCDGLKWVDVGNAMGITKKAVHKMKIRITEKLLRA